MGSVGTEPSIWGFPGPSDVQQPKADNLFANAIFSRTPNKLQPSSADSYDFIVVGSGCTALAFIDETLRINPRASILCLERGGLLLPTHFQSLAAPFKRLIGGASETYPWTLSRRTYESDLGYCHGYYPFFGGRSLFWSGWCPEPSMKSLRSFPHSMREAAARPNFWADARRVLNVFSTAEVDDCAFGKLQKELSTRLALPLNSLDCLESSEPAMLAASERPTKGKTSFSKFCAAEALLRTADQQRAKANAKKGMDLNITLDCPVESIVLDDDGHAIGIMTGHGMMDLNPRLTKVILCAGAIPNTTILYNSVPNITRTAGKRLTGHFISHITCRLPLNQFMGTVGQDGDGQGLQIAAQCLLGYHPDSLRQFQIQVTAVHSLDPHEQMQELDRKCPDMSASACPQMLFGSEQHVVLLCAIIGEFTEDNEQCWLRHQKGAQDKLTNIELQYLCNDEDYALWSYMEDATFDLLGTALAPKQEAAMMANGANGGNDMGRLEFWARDKKCWTTARPESAKLRVQGVVHEGSSTFVGAEECGGSLDEYYRPHGVKGVHVTGAGLFPTAGAFNPTLPMCGFAQHLAQMLNA